MRLRIPFVTVFCARGPNEKPTRSRRAHNEKCSILTRNLTPVYHHCVSNIIFLSGTTPLITLHFHPGSHNTTNATVFSSSKRLHIIYDTCFICFHIDTRLALLTNVESKYLHIIRFHKFHVVYYI